MTDKKAQINGIYVLNSFFSDSIINISNSNDLKYDLISNGSYHVHHIVMCIGRKDHSFAPQNNL